MSSRTPQESVFVSYFTAEYQAEAAKLRDSLVAHGLKHDIRPLQSRGTWEKNCAHKPEFLLSCLQDHGRPVVWVDADARIRQFPELIASEQAGVDMIVHYRDGVELMTGTVYVGNSDEARLCLQRWAAMCDAHPREWDQRCLQRIIRTIPCLVTGNLPAGYCWVKEFMAGNPIIEHTQASRRLRAKVNQ